MMEGQPINLKETNVAHPYSKELRVRLAYERGISVDPEDMWLIEDYTWNLDKDGYAVTNNRSDVGTCKLHHCIIGCPLYGYETDHTDEDRANNRRSNLSIVTHIQNMSNNSQVRAGRHWDITPKGMYRVRANGKYLGVFLTQKEAEEAYARYRNDDATLGQEQTPI
jgi:hypothetical protein